LQVVVRFLVSYLGSYICQLRKWNYQTSETVERGQLWQWKTFVAKITSCLCNLLLLNNNAESTINEFPRSSSSHMKTGEKCFGKDFLNYIEFPLVIFVARQNPSHMFQYLSLVRFHSWPIFRTFLVLYLTSSYTIFISSS